MRYVPEGEEEPPQVRRLRLMTMGLMVVLMVGFVLMVAVIVIRVGFAGPGFVEASEFALPPGEIVATGRGEGTVMFVITDGDAERLLIFDASTGALESVVPITRK